MNDGNERAITGETSTLTMLHGSNYSGIQVLRVIAALMVVVLHSILYSKERLGSEHFDIKWGSGVSGVDIFFVISGFVMFYSSTRLVDKADGWKTFSLRRIARIVPLYWIATTLKLIVMFVAPAAVLHATIAPHTVILSYLFLPTRNMDGLIEPLLGVGWTLTFEMFFYFVFALALFFRVNVFRFVGPVMILCALGSVFRRPSWPAASVYLDDIVLEFVFGMVLAQLCLVGKRLRPRLAVPLFFGTLGYLVGPWHIHGPRSVTVGIPAFLLCWCTASLEPWVHNHIPKVVLFFGDASYALYLFHPLCAPAAPTLLAKIGIHSSWLSIGLSIMIAISASSIAYKLVDRPIMGWSRKFTLAADSIAVGG